MANDDLEILRVDCKGYEFVGRPYQRPASGMDHYWTLAELKILLARQGLYVVTAADKAVLDAMSMVPRSDITTARAQFRTPNSVCTALTAELARRGSTK